MLQGEEFEYLRLWCEALCTIDRDFEISFLEINAQGLNRVMVCLRPTFENPRR